MKLQVANITAANHCGRSNAQRASVRQGVMDTPYYERIHKYRLASRHKLVLESARVGVPCPRTRYRSFGTKALH